jgi:hypothetical protein
MEENLQNKMLVRALVDPDVAKALVNPKNANDAKLLLREVQSVGYLSRALMADIGVTSSQLAMQDRQVPIEGMEGLPVVSRETSTAAPAAAASTAAASRSGPSASTMLKEMPVAPPTRGMPPSALSPRFGVPPPPAPPAPGMYQALFPEDPISKLLQQRQAQTQGAQTPPPGQ